VVGVTVATGRGFAASVEVRSRVKARVMPDAASTSASVAATSSVTRRVRPVEVPFPDVMSSSRQIVGRVARLCSFDPIVRPSVRPNHPREGDGSVAGG
jgi:hypothetical protein